MSDVESVSLAEEKCSAPLVVLTGRLPCRDGVLSVTCVVFSGLDAAREIGVLTFVLWESIAGGFFGTLQLREFWQRELRHRGG
jgi:hypothetical protein